jgi:hypothetical protein
MRISNTKQWFKIQTFSIQKRYLQNPNTNFKFFPTFKHTYPSIFVGEKSNTNFKCSFKHSNLINPTMKKLCSSDDSNRLMNVSIKTIQFSYMKHNWASPFRGVEVGILW